MRLFDEHPRARWAVPVTTAALLVVGAAVAPAAVSADPTLPPRTASELLVDLQQPTLEAFSGTVVTRADLGLPDLPEGLGGPAGALISGESTLRVWVDGPQRQRLALLAPMSETVLIRNDTQLWKWSSDTTTAESYQLDHEAHARPVGPGDAAMTDLPSTPQEAAELALDALDPTTEVRAVGTDRIADRDAYLLGMTPRDPDTLVRQVSVAIDAETHVPLRVRVYSTTGTDPTLEVAYSAVSYEVPDAALFDFSPPPGATVMEHPASTEQADAFGPKAEMRAPTLVGSGWSTILLGELPSEATEPAGEGPAAIELLRLLPAESGEWGTGRVLRGTLFSVIITDDGRVAVGAVAPQALMTALAEQ